MFQLASITVRPAIALWVLVLLALPSFGADRLNVLWITFEDCSPILGCDGESLSRTPTLDRLAREGVRYTQAFSPSGVCAPSRAALITGCYPTAIGAMHHRTGQRLAPKDGTLPTLPPSYEALPPPDVRCFPELLRSAGYYCTNRSKRDYQFKEPVTVWDACSREAPPKNRGVGQPFFAVFNFNVTHESRLFERTRTATTDRSRVSVPPYLPDTPTVREGLARQIDNVSELDRRVSKLLAELEKGGLLENTVIFVFADHGSGIARGKRWVLDSGTRVPLIIRFPDERNFGTTEPRLVSFVDFAPTVLSLCGVEVPTSIQGRSFLPPTAAPPRPYAFMARDRTDERLERIRSVRSPKYRYVWNGLPGAPHHPHVNYHARVPMVAEIERLAREKRLGPHQWQLARSTKPNEELYDLTQDPHEIHNLAADPDYANTIVELRAALANWQRRHADLGLLDEADYDQQIRPDGVQPVTATPEVDRTSERLTISCTTRGASIGWRVIGEKAWRVYTSSVPLLATAKIEVVAHRIGYRPSPIVR